MNLANICKISSFELIYKAFMLMYLSYFKKA
jgi:hypothetical protein